MVATRPSSYSRRSAIASAPPFSCLRLPRRGSWRSGRTGPASGRPCSLRVWRGACVGLVVKGQRCLFLGHVQPGAGVAILVLNNELIRPDHFPPLGLGGRCDCRQRPDQGHTYKPEPASDQQAAVAPAHAPDTVRAMLPRPRHVAPRPHVRFLVAKRYPAQGPVLSGHSRREVVGFSGEAEASRHVTHEPGSRSRGARGPPHRSHRSRPRSRGERVGLVA